MTVEVMKLSDHLIGHKLLKSLPGMCQCEGCSSITVGPSTFYDL